MIKRPCIWLLIRLLSSNSSGQVGASVTKRYTWVPAKGAHNSYHGLCRSNTAIAMSDFVIFPTTGAARWPVEGDEHPTYALESHGGLYITTTAIKFCKKFCYIQQVMCVLLQLMSCGKSLHHPCGSKCSVTHLWAKCSSVTVLCSLYACSLIPKVITAVLMHGSSV